MCLIIANAVRSLFIALWECSDIYRMNVVGPFFFFFFCSFILGMFVWPDIHNTHSRSMKQELCSCISYRRCLRFVLPSLMSAPRVDLPVCRSRRPAATSSSCRRASSGTPSTTFPSISSPRYVPATDVGASRCKKAFGPSRASGEKRKQDGLFLLVIASLVVLVEEMQVVIWGLPAVLRRSGSPALRKKREQRLLF